MSDINITVNDEIVNIDVIDTPVVVEVTNSPGPAGAGVAAGGTTGQVLAKASNTNYDTVWVNPSTGGVPYSGATGNVNLGEYELKAGQLTLDTSPTGTAAVGTTRWNDTTGTSETTLKGGSVVLKNGVDLVARVVNKVTPNTTLTKAAYQAVRVSGAQGQRLAIELAQANNDAGSADTIGLVTETIATNQEGFIMTMGQLENINTTGSLQGETWVDGDVLYLSPTTAGAITNVQPTGSGHIVVIGYVEYAHANNGKIYVKVLNGWELTELHDTEIISPANNEALIYESSSALWKNKTIPTALGYTPANAATTLTINGVTYDLSTSRTWTIAAGISGSGTTNYLPKFTGSTTLGNSLFQEGINAIALGVTPSAWDTTYKVYEAPGNAFVAGFSGQIQIGQNAYYSGGWKYKTTAVASKYYQVNGTHVWQTAPSGIIDTNITYTQAMTLDASGNLGIGITPTVRLHVSGDTILRGSGATLATTALTVQNSSSTNLFRVYNDGTATLQGSFTINNGTFYFINQYTANGDFFISASGSTNVLFTNGVSNNFGRLQLGGTSASYPSIKRASNNIEIKNADDTFGAGLSVGASLNASAILQADSTTKGFLPPRMTTTQKNAIATPAAGLVVYDTTDNKHYGYDGTTWNAFY